VARKRLRCASCWTPATAPFGRERWSFRTENAEFKRANAILKDASVLSRLDGLALARAGRA
jgi:hypothetical protein